MISKRISKRMQRRLGKEWRDILRQQEQQKVNANATKETSCLVPKGIENTGMECSAILYIQKHGKEGWDYAFENYCDNCGCIDTCNIVNGTVEITPKGIKIMEELLATINAKKEVLS